MLSHSSTATPVEEVPETPFYIPGTGSSTRPRRTLKHGDCFAVLDSHADIGASPGGPDGIFFCDTRYLSHLEMLLNGRQPLLLGSAVRDDNSFLTVDLTNPDIYLDQKLVQPKDMLHVVRTLFLLHGTVYQRLRMQNHGDRPFDVRLSLRLRQRLRRSVRGARTAPHAPRHRERGGRRSRRRAELPGPRRQSAAHDCCCSSRRRSSSPSSLASYAFDLQPNESRSIYVTVNCDRGAEKHIALAVSQGPARGVSAAPGREPRHGHDHQLEPDLQRGDMPLDGRPRDADDRHAARSLSLCRHSLVLDHVRPRRDHHRAADAVVRFSYRQRRAAAARRLSGHRHSIRSPTPSPEKSCTRCAAAKWRRCARSRSASITAAWMRRRCS